MERKRVLHFYLNDAQHREIAAATAGILTRIVGAVKAAGWSVELQPLERPVGGDGYHLVFNQAVDVPFCLCLRRVYLNPFWRIEATNDRWDWDVARLAYDSSRVSNHAQGFQNRWRDIVFKGLEITQGGYVFMPLQGKLDIKRHFQAMSPLAMIAATLKADPARRIIATLHPSETYSDQELAALRGFGARFEVSDMPSKTLLSGCDYVVTQNSGMGLIGWFADKPAVLFGRIDFHHMAGSVLEKGVAGAFADAQTKAPYAGYLHWFFKQQAITYWDAKADERILARFREHGWPM
jgi:hypothetical protein